MTVMRADKSQNMNGDDKSQRTKRLVSFILVVMILMTIYVGSFVMAYFTVPAVREFYQLTSQEWAVIIIYFELLVIGDLVVWMPLKHLASWRRTREVSSNRVKVAASVNSSRWHECENDNAERSVMTKVVAGLASYLELVLTIFPSVFVSVMMLGFNLGNAMAVISTSTLFSVESFIQLSLIMWIPNSVSLVMLQAAMSHEGIFSRDAQEKNQLH